jgi:DNA-binding NarL/FixJ family response regulator
MAWDEGGSFDAGDGAPGMLAMISVLIVDDHELFRAGLRSRLENESDITPVGEAGTVEQAVVKARTLQPDLVLLDLLLPRKSGYEAIPELVRVSPESKVLVVSSHAAPSSVRRAISAGASGYIPKRASYDELVTAIRRVAAGERYVDPDLGAQLIVADGAPALEPLSDRERDVLHLLALGYTNQEIGKKLFISVRTVDTHRAHNMRKLRHETRAELVLFALATGLIGPS